MHRRNDSRSRPIIVLRVTIFSVGQRRLRFVVYATIVVTKMRMTATCQSQSLNISRLLREFPRSRKHKDSNAAKKQVRRRQR